MTENLQADCVQSCQTCFVQYFLRQEELQMQKQEQNIKTMSPDSNEALCIRIQQGDEQAKSQLLQQNEGKIGRAHV